MTITPFDPHHACACERLILNSFREFVAPTLPAHERRAFIRFVQSHALRRRSRHHAMLTAVVCDRPVAFAEIKPGNHLLLLFVDAEWVGRGVGSALLAEVEGYCRLLGPRITVNATPNAVTFYEAKGYRSANRPRRAGSACLPMEKEWVLEKRRTAGGPTHWH